ncbi:MAG: rod-binding protein [Alphaproteobacteria bacterium]|nr:rod-binding protein [Alphaproteobacteria bacterium]
MNAASLTPDTSIALMQAAQENNALAAEKVKQAKMHRIEDAAHEFEAVFTAEMLKPMFEGISTEGMFGGGKGEEVFRGMLLQEYGKLMARTGSVGLSTPIKEAMIKMQEQADNAAQAETQ